MTAHAFTMTEENASRPWQARCACGWTTWHYVTEEAAWIASEAHLLQVALSR